MFFPCFDIPFFKDDAFSDDESSHSQQVKHRRKIIDASSDDDENGEKSPTWVDTAINQLKTGTKRSNKSQKESSGAKRLKITTDEIQDSNEVTSNDSDLLVYLKKMNVVVDSWNKRHE